MKLYCVMILMALELNAQVGTATSPDITSYESPITTDNINIFTGDFNLNLNLLSIPNNGSDFQINAFYNSGIYTNQESSWLGLGWNLNPGAIERTSIGYPDDFDGSLGPNVKRQSVTEFAAGNKYKMNIFGDVLNPQYRSDAGQRGAKAYAEYFQRFASNLAGSATSYGSNSGDKEKVIGILNGSPSPESIMTARAIGIAEKRASINTAIYNRFLNESTKTVGNVFSSSLKGHTKMRLSNSNLPYDFSKGADEEAGEKENYSYKAWAHIYDEERVFGPLYYEKLDETYINSDFATSDLNDESKNFAETNGMVSIPKDIFSVNAVGISGRMSIYRHGYGYLKGKYHIKSETIFNDSFNVTSNYSYMPWEKNFSNGKSFKYLNDISGHRERTQDDIDYQGIKFLSVNVHKDLTFSPTTEIDEFTQTTFQNDSPISLGNYIEYFTNADLGNNDSTYSSSIAKFIITSKDGVVYEFGKAAYVNYEVTKNLPKDFSQFESPINTNGGYSLTYKNSQKYAYAWYLTSIKSSDYVDRGETGFDEADFGSYIKFSYGLYSSNFNFRSPFAKNFLSDKGNKSVDPNFKTYTRGDKEIYYLEKIETRTHTAIFYKAERQDSEEPEYFGFDDGPNMLLLKKILLFNNDNLPNIIDNGSIEGIYDEDDTFENIEGSQKIVRGVEFNYDYSLAKGIPDNFNNNGGRLTLRSIKKLGPAGNRGIPSTDFNYYEENKEYNSEYVDRWGYYVEREEDENKISSKPWTWSLKSVLYPTGATLNIEYESKDYGFVQDIELEDYGLELNGEPVKGKKGGGPRVSKIQFNSGNNETNTYYKYREFNSPLISSSVATDEPKSRIDDATAGLSVHKNVLEPGRMGYSFEPSPTIMNSYIRIESDINKDNGYTEYYFHTPKTKKNILSYVEQSVSDSDGDSGFSNPILWNLEVNLKSGKYSYEDNSSIWGQLIKESQMNSDGEEVASTEYFYKNSVKTNKHSYELPLGNNIENYALYSRNFQVGLNGNGSIESRKDYFRYSFNTLVENKWKLSSVVNSRDQVESSITNIEWDYYTGDAIIYTSVTDQVITTKITPAYKIVEYAGMGPKTENTANKNMLNTIGLEETYLGDHTSSQIIGAIANTYKETNDNIWQANDTFIWLRSSVYDPFSDWNYDPNESEANNILNSWKRIQNITKYDKFGNQIEEKLFTGKYNSTLYDKRGHYVVANIFNAKVDEVKFYDFEEKTNDSALYYNINPLLYTQSNSVVEELNVFVPEADFIASVSSSITNTTHAPENTTFIKITTQNYLNETITVAEFINGDNSDLISFKKGKSYQIVLNAWDGDYQVLGSTLIPTKSECKLKIINVPSMPFKTGKNSAEYPAIFSELEFPNEAGIYNLSAWIWPLETIVYNSISYEVNKWHLIELNDITDLSLLSAIPGSGYIDHIRISPTNARIVSYSYDYKNGLLISQTDVNNLSTNYYYDSLNRLIGQADDDQQIIKKHSYLYSRETN